MLGSQADDINLRHHLPHKRRYPAIQDRSSPRPRQHAARLVYIPLRRLAIRLPHLRANLPGTTHAIQRIIFTLVVSIFNVFSSILDREVRTTKVTGELVSNDSEAQINSSPSHEPPVFFPRDAHALITTNATSFRVSHAGSSGTVHAAARIIWAVG